MASSTGQAIREELEKWGLVRLLGSCTATSGGSNRLRDATRLASTGLPSSAFDDCYVRMSSGTRDGEQVKVDYLDQDNGDLYVSPSFSGTTLSGETYEIWRAGIDPDDVDRARDEALTKLCSQWALQPISELPNADFEDALSSSNWVDQATASSAIQTLSFPFELWRNSLLVTNTAANDYTRSASLYTRPERYFYLYVPVSARVGTAELIVRDVTNGANISLSGPGTTVTGRGWTAFEATGQVPADCYEIQVWLRGQGATAVVEWGPVCFHWQGQQQIAIPSRIVSRKHVGRVYRLENYLILGTPQSWGYDTPTEVPGVRVRQVRDATVLYFSREYPLTTQPHFYEERIYFDALSSAYLTAANRTTGDAATTLCPLDYVTASTVKALALQYMYKLPHETEFWTGLLNRTERELADLEVEFGPEVHPKQERTRQVYVPSLGV